MIQEETFDVAVIGAGAAGLAAATVTAAAGKKTIVIDREDRPGGILRQCIHNGFGLRYFKEELTGPEYAERVAEKAEKAGAELRLGATVIELAKEADGSLLLIALSPKEGVRKIHARAVILAMGCRERNRGNLAIPGSRPAGVFTAGAAQKLLNIEGILPGKKAVIVGSGDIGLIMARRLRWAGIKVEAVVEIMPYPAGLTRNIVQCLNDFEIPLYLEHSVVNILGRERVEGVEVAPLRDGIPQTDRKFHIDCDTVLFSVGLIPENELSSSVGVALNPSTGGPLVDSNYETNVPGIFAGGNVLHVHDLVDFVSEEAEHAAEMAVRRLDGETFAEEASPVKVESNLKYVVPNRFRHGRDTRFAFRSLIVSNNAELEAELNGTIIWKHHYNYIRPAEMLIVDLKAEQLKDCGELVFRLKKGEEK